MRPIQDHTAHTAAFTKAIGKLCLSKHARSLSAQALAARESGKPVSNAVNLEGSFATCDANLNSLLQTSLQPIRAKFLDSEPAQPGQYAKTAERVEALPACSNASAFGSLPAEHGLMTAAPGEAYTDCAAHAAADLLAWNVLMVPHAIEHLPQAGKEQLQEKSMFFACCRALLRLTKPQQASSLLSSQGVFLGLPYPNDRTAAGSQLTWIRCAWAVSSMLHLAAGQLEQRVLVSTAQHLVSDAAMGSC